LWCLIRSQMAQVDAAGAATSVTAGAGFDVEVFGCSGSSSGDSLIVLVLASPS
jgi:hypothetical protein